MISYTLAQNCLKNKRDISKILKDCIVASPCILFVEIEWTKNLWLMKNCSSRYFVDINSLRLIKEISQKIFIEFHVDSISKFHKQQIYYSQLTNKLFP